MRLERFIRHFPGFPYEGIVFHDISPLLADADAFRECVGELAARIAPWRPDYVAGIESRGFLLASALALHMGIGMVMIRKTGKLPGPVLQAEYALEYGTGILEMQRDAVPFGARVVVLDDLLATGGTFQAAVRLLRSAGAVVPGAACLLELAGLDGRARVDVDLVSLLVLEGA